MSDIVTRLLLKTNDFDANLNKSKKNVNGFQSDILRCLALQYREL